MAAVRPTRARRQAIRSVFKLAVPPGNISSESLQHLSWNAQTGLCHIVALKSRFKSNHRGTARASPAQLLVKLTDSDWLRASDSDSHPESGRLRLGHAALTAARREKLQLGLGFECRTHWQTTMIYVCSGRAQAASRAGLEAAAAAAAGLGARPSNLKTPGEHRAARACYTPGQAPADSDVCDRTSDRKSALCGGWASGARGRARAWPPGPGWCGSLLVEPGLGPGRLRGKAARRLPHPAQALARGREREKREKRERESEKLRCKMLVT